MAAAKLKLTIEQGSTFRKTLTWKAGTPQLPIDLTGCTARMHIRSAVSAATTLHEMTTENGGIVLGGALGTIELIIIPAVTETFTWTDAVYDLEVVFFAMRISPL